MFRESYYGFFGKVLRIPAPGSFARHVEEQFLLFTARLKISAQKEIYEKQRQTYCTPVFFDLK